MSAWVPCRRVDASDRLTVECLEEGDPWRRWTSPSIVCSAVNLSAAEAFAGNHQVVG